MASVTTLNPVENLPMEDKKPVRSKSMLLFDSVEEIPKSNTTTIPKKRPVELNKKGKKGKNGKNKQDDEEKEHGRFKWVPKAAPKYKPAKYNDELKRTMRSPDPHRYPPGFFSTIRRSIREATVENGSAPGLPADILQQPIDDPKEPKRKRGPRPEKASEVAAKKEFEATRIGSKKSYSSLNTSIAHSSLSDLPVISETVDPIDKADKIDNEIEKIDSKIIDTNENKNIEKDISNPNTNLDTTEKSTSVAGVNTASESTSVPISPHSVKPPHESTKGRSMLLYDNPEDVPPTKAIPRAKKQEQNDETDKTDKADKNKRPLTRSASKLGLKWAPRNHTSATKPKKNGFFAKTRRTLKNAIVESGPNPSQDSIPEEDETTQVQETNNKKSAKNLIDKKINKNNSNLVTPISSPNRTTSSLHSTSSHSMIITEKSPLRAEPAAGAAAAAAASSSFLEKTLTNNVGEELEVQISQKPDDSTLPKITNPAPAPIITDKDLVNLKTEKRKENVIEIFRDSPAPAEVVNIEDTKFTSSVEKLEESSPTPSKDVSPINTKLSNISTNIFSDNDNSALNKKDSASSLSESSEQVNKFSFASPKISEGSFRDDASSVPTTPASTVKKPFSSETYVYRSMVL